MRALFDTHIFIWAAFAPSRVGRAAAQAIADPDTEVLLSAVVIWEIAIKAARERPDFGFDPVAVFDRALEAGWQELPVTARHALAVGDLPPHHADPFDRMLIAQARVEGVPFYTADRALAVYGPPVVPAR